jgi:hypothetical protein
LCAGFVPRISIKKTLRAVLPVRYISQKELTVPERLNFASFLEIADDKAVRSELIQRIKEIFSDCIGNATELVLMDYTSAGRIVKWTFPDAIPNLQCDLSTVEILFIYFNDNKKVGNSILSISRNSDAFVYTISLPNLEMLARHDDLLSRLAELHLEMSDMGIHCVVLAGGELTIEKDFRSVDEVIQAASNRDSLVEYLCCDKNDAPQSTEFTPARESGAGAVYRRHRNKGDRPCCSRSGA